MKENTKPKPCLECESYTTGECVSKIPCDMNYSAFKPSKTKKKAGCRPEQQLNKPPDVIEEFVKEGEEHYLFPLHGRFELVKKWINQACTHLEALLKQIKELEAENRWIPVSELPEKNTRCLVFANFKSKNPPIKIYKDVFINTYSGNGKWDVYKELTITHWKPITLPALQEKGE